MTTMGMIERFLDGEMNEAEKLKFEQALQSDVNLRNELRIHAEVNESISDEEKDKLRKKITDILKQNPIKRDTKTTKKSKKIFISRSIIIAASFLFITAIGGILLIINEKPYSNTELFAYYYEPYNPNFTTRSAEQNTRDNAYELYENGNYEAAATEFKLILKDKQLDSMARLYLGISYLELNKYYEAIDEFNFILENDLYPYVYHAEWYLSLTYLKMNNLTEAKTILNEIENHNSFYKVKAEDILDKLN